MTKSTNSNVQTFVIILCQHKEIHNKGQQLIDELSR